MKLERNTDPFVSLPLPENSEWTPVGHTIRINPAMSSFSSIPSDSRAVKTQVYRFDKHKPSSNFVKNSVQSFSNMTKLKIGNEMKSYVKDLERIAALGLPWVNKFVGSVGKGISGSEEERRYVV